MDHRLLLTRRQNQKLNLDLYLHLHLNLYLYLNLNLNLNRTATSLATRTNDWILLHVRVLLYVFTMPQFISMGCSTTCDSDSGALPKTEAEAEEEEEEEEAEEAEEAWQQAGDVTRLLFAQKLVVVVVASQWQINCTANVLLSLSFAIVHHALSLSLATLLTSPFVVLILLPLRLDLNASHCTVSCHVAISSCNNTTVATTVETTVATAGASCENVHEIVSGSGQRKIYAIRRKKIAKCATNSIDATDATDATNTTRRCLRLQQRSQRLLLLRHLPIPSTYFSPMG
ncbi:hypothetical protein ACLKA6_000583 [Drosophila palustris]